MSLDALSSLGDLLPTDAPKPKAPEEGKHKKEEGVLVGERDDTLPPDYRFNREALEKLPAPKPEPTIGTGEALDFLSDALTTPLATSASLDTALDALAGDFIPSTAASAVSSAPCEPDLQVKLNSTAADNALDALSDTLADIKPAPQPVPVLTKDVVKEKKILEERLIKMGERDDTLPPEFRPTEEDLKPTMGTGEALDILSGDFVTMTAGPAVHAPVVTPSAPAPDYSFKREELEKLPASKLEVRLA
uniref:Calpastatin n=1 Tax=Stegastes partitus TaxID=144197 RepID=A0A3B5AU15_9TELE